MEIAKTWAFLPDILSFRSEEVVYQQADSNVDRSRYE
jgi:hypothetical protein